MQDFLEENKEKIIYTEEAIRVMTEANEILEREFEVALQESNIVLPFPKVYIFKYNDLQAYSTTTDNSKYYIVLHKGLFTIHRQFLMEVNNGSLLKKGQQYINDIIEYTWKFVLFHEYGHLLCGHSLTDKHHIIAQECEADCVSSDALIKLILTLSECENYEEELVKCFIAIFYFFEHMDKLNESESYNIFYPCNYYEDMNRDHPLNSQRIIYIFQEFSFFILGASNKTLCIRNKIIEELINLGECLTTGERVNALWAVAADSIDNIRTSVEEIRKMIPRLGDFQFL